MADPGFPVVGCGPPTRVLLVKMYAKSKELGPVGRRAPGLDPPMLISRDKRHLVDAASVLFLVHLVDAASVLFLVDCAW